MSCCNFRTFRIFLVLAVPMAMGPGFCFADQDKRWLLGHYEAVAAMFLGGIAIQGIIWLMLLDMSWKQVRRFVPILAVIIAGVGQHLVIRVADPPVSHYPSILVFCLCQMASSWIAVWWLRIGRARPIVLARVD